jgi:hypothetical protein
VTAEHGPRRDGPPPHRVFPVLSLAPDLDLAHDEREDPVEDLLLVGDVLVERHRLDAELSSQVAGVIYYAWTWPKLGSTDVTSATV